MRGRVTTLEEMIASDQQKEVGLLIHNGGREYPTECLLILPHQLTVTPTSTVLVKNAAIWPKKDIIIKGPDHSRISVWVIPFGKSPRSAEVIVYIERNLEWIVKEGEDECLCGPKANCSNMCYTSFH